MKKHLVFILLMLLPVCYMQAQQHKPSVATAGSAEGRQYLDFNLWPNDLDRYAQYPSVRVYLPQSVKPTRAIVICPGGGYSHLAMTHEGNSWADFFRQQGMAAIVVKYQLPQGNGDQTLEDLRTTFRLIRQHAHEWNILPDSIGIMGSSAGGHLATTYATHQTDSLRPAFQVLLYPVVSLEKGITHRGTRNRFLGENPADSLVHLYSNQYQVTASTPRAFIALSQDDNAVPPINSLLYYQALLQHHVPAVIHVYPSGRHGWGIKSSFPYQKEFLMNLSSWLNSF